MPVTFHTRVVNKCLARLYAEFTPYGVLAWKQQVGFAAYDDKPVQYGVPGQPDIGGILLGGTALQIEVKTGAASLSQKQRDWRRACELLRCQYHLMRVPAEEDLEAALDDLIKRIRARTELPAPRQAGPARGV